MRLTPDCGLERCRWTDRIVPRHGRFRSWRSFRQRRLVKGSLAEIGKRKIGTDVVDRRDVVADGPEAESPVTNEFNLVVEALQCPVGNTECGPSQDSIHVGTNQLCKFLHRLKTAVAGFPEPVAEEPLGVEAALVVPEELKVFFQEVSADESKIETGQIEQGVALGIREVPGIFEQDEAGSFDEVSVRSRQSADFGAPDLVDGIEQMADQMKTIKNKSGPRKVFADRFGVGRPHIATDGVNRAGAPAVEPMEEGIQRFFLPVFTDPDQAMTFQIVDQGQVAVTALAADFIDTDDVECLPPALLQAFGDDAPNDLDDRLPIELEMSGNFQPVKLPGQQGNGRRQRHGDPAPGFGPGNLFHFDLLAAWATDAERLVVQFQQTIAQTQVPPCSRFQPAVSSAASGATVAASELAFPDSRHMSDDGFIGFLDVRDVVGFHCELFSDKRFHAHWTVGPPGGVATGRIA